MELGEPSSVQMRNPNRARTTHHDLNSQELDVDISLDGLQTLEPTFEQEEEGGEQTNDYSSDTDAYSGPPEVGMMFETHHKASRFYRRYAQRTGFGVSVRRSSFTKDGDKCLYLELMCCKGGRPRSEAKFRKRASATTNCPARMRVKLWGDGKLHLELVVLEHNHPVSPSMARYLDRYKQLPGSEKRRLRTSQGRVLPPEEPSRMPINRLAELEELLFGETEGSRGFVDRGRVRLSPGDAEGLRLFFTKMQAKNPNFFTVVDLDDEGGIRGAFWSDSRSRAAYEYYSDVLYLDTSCVVARYEVPLVTFVGVNHHGQSVLFACAVLSDETSESYAWLLKTFIACMGGNFPGAIITDHCKNIHGAVSVVLPSVTHRMCLYQIMKRVTERLGGLADYRGITKCLQSAVFDSLTIEGFEEEWRRLIEVYELHNNDWLRSLYEYRYLWVPIFLKDAFWAGMSATQRTDVVIPFFEGFIDLKTTLKQFLGKYELALQTKYEKEAQADFETFHKRRPAVSKFYMEEQLSKVYTLNMFKLFQDEIEAIMYCYATITSIEGPVSTFNVNECVFLDESKRSVNKSYVVTFDTEGKNVNCICGYFQFKGILCRHALSVFKLQQVHEIPASFVLDRWKKEFKKLHVIAHNSDNNDEIANNRIDRYDYLSMRCLQLAEVGVLSDKYRLALRLIKEVENFLLSDGTHDDTQPRIKSQLNKSKKVVRDENQGLKEKESQGTSGKQVAQETEKGNTNATNGQMSGAEQTAPKPSIVYMFPGGFDPQAFGNGPPMMPPWAFQHMLQMSQFSNQVQTQNPSQNPVKQTKKRRRVNRSNKASEENQENQE